MNIDRPLDEIIQESRDARRAERAAKRKTSKQVRKPQAHQPRSQNQPMKNPLLKTTPQANNNASNTDSRANDAPKLGPSKKRAGITKPQKRRVRVKTRPQHVVDMERNEDRVVENVRSEIEQVRNAGGVAGRLTTAKNARAVKGVKVAVSNLHPGVTETDIKELFETVGSLKKATLKTYANGLSACEAEVVFDAMSDALEAIKRYNLVPLDNQPLHITLATDSMPNSEPVQNRIGKPRGRGNIRKKMPSPDVVNYEGAYSPRGHRGRDSPIEERGGHGGQGRRMNRRRFNNNRRFPNKAGANGNGNVNGDRDLLFVD